MFAALIRRRVGRVRGESTMMRLPVAILFLIGAIGFYPDVSSAKQPDPKDYVGHFTVLVRGYWTGQGSATVAAGSVQIVASVTDDQGNVGTLSTSNLKIVDGHFSGSGTVFGVKMKLEGRVDASDLPPSVKSGGDDAPDVKGPGDQVLLNARIGATFTAGTHGGRIAGSRDE